MPQRKSLLRNNCDGTFTDVTVASGLAKPGDEHADGRVGRHRQRRLARSVRRQRGRARRSSFATSGDGTFEDIARAAGVARTAFTKGVRAGDFDNDGYADFYVSNLGGGNSSITTTATARSPRWRERRACRGRSAGFPAWFFDYDNDGWDDLFVTSYFLSIDENGALVPAAAAQRQHP